MFKLKRKRRYRLLKTDIKIRFATFALALLMLIASAGCSGDNNNGGNAAVLEGGVKLEAVDVSGKTLLLTSSQAASTLAVPAALATMDTEYTARDKDVGYEQSTATTIKLDGATANISGAGAEFADGDIKITAEGTYVFSGMLDDGTIFVEAADTAKVQLVFDGVTVKCSDFAAIFIKEADKVFITLNEGKINSLTDGVLYTLTEKNSVVDGDQKNVDAVIYSRSDLTINGSGTLNVVGNYKHAVVSKDDLVITGGILNISAPNGGLYGSDSVKIGGGYISVTSGSDGIRADNNAETDRGFVLIDGGSIAISAGSDGIQAASAIFIKGGTTLLSAVKRPIKCGSVAMIDGGTVAALGGEFDCPVGDSSAQPNILFPFGSAIKENTPLAVAANGETVSIATFKSLRPATVLFFTTPGITAGTEYSLYNG